MIYKLLTEHHLEFLSLKGGCTCSFESTHATLLEISCTCIVQCEFITFPSRACNNHGDVLVSILQD